MKTVATVAEEPAVSPLANPQSDAPVVVRLGQQLIEMGKIAPTDIARIIANQRARGLRFGEAAVDLGLLTPDDLRRALSEQNAYPYVEVGGSWMHSALVAAHKPFDAAAEAIRGLRSQLSLRWFTERRKALAVAGARAGAGSSSIAANLAVCFAQLGRRTLLVDANLRAPRLADLFGIHGGHGLSDVLAGRCRPGEATGTVQPFAQLSLLASGPVPPNPQELLGRVGFSYLLETSRAAYDVVIVDTPPALEYSDAHLIAAGTAGYLLVARRHRTRLADLDRVRGEMTHTGASLVGTVITDS
jgi:chain length determinant protein tyrosine kinase EpsG